MTKVQVQTFYSYFWLKCEIICYQSCIFSNDKKETYTFSHIRTCSKVMQFNINELLKTKCNATKSYFSGEVEHCEKNLFFYVDWEVNIHYKTLNVFVIMCEKQNFIFNA